MRGPLAIALFLTLLSVGWSQTVLAAQPPSELMEARLKQAREARTPLRASVSLTLTTKGVRDLSGSVRLVSNGSFTLTGREDDSLKVGSDSKDSVGQLVAWLVLSSDPVDGLTARGEFEPKKTGVEVIDDVFGYRYGVLPALVVKRSLDHILEVRWKDDGVSWVARFEHGDEPWPRVLSVTRSGRPFLRLEITPEP